MRRVLNRVLDEISSLRLTIFCLSAALVLVLAGTLAQVRLGLFFVQESYFQSWFVRWAISPDGLRIPVFPGGHLIGAVLLVNLLTAHVRRFKWTSQKFGIQLTHLGLIVMLAGGLATDLFSVSSYLRLKRGETKNYSEDSMRMELAVTDQTDPGADQVTAIPGSVLSQGGTITDASLPFRILVRSFYRNSELKMTGQSTETLVPAASNGTGARVSVRPRPRATRMDERDVMSAVLEISPLDGGTSLGTWLVSDALAAAQEFELRGRHWSLQLRSARYYKPYSITLKEFTHEVYPGTRIPKDFSSTVQLSDPENRENRQARIYMNHPLRYLGETYYQSGFEPDDSGTVLQVVRNPGYQTPYIACVLVSLGLLFQFALHLTRFSRRSKKVACS
jgi:hypothetical protein